MSPSPNASGPARIFISYRRSDSQDVADHLYERLVDRFTRDAVFKDVDSIPGGVDFRESIRGDQRSDVVLAIIGPEWLNATGPDGQRRLEDPSDYVRAEIEMALQRHIPVIPVIVRNGTPPPESALPGNLKPLAFRSALPLRPGPDFNRDLSRLILAIERFSGSGEPRERRPIGGLLSSPGNVRLRCTTASIVALVLVPTLVLVLWLIYQGVSKIGISEQAMQSLLVTAVSPLPFVGSLAALAAWAWAYHRSGRLRVLLSRLGCVPREDRASLIRAEMGEVLPETIDPEQWLRAREQSYRFLGYLALCFLVLCLAGIGAWAALGARKHGGL